MFGKLFGRSRKKAELQAGPAILFGRYSDNNKPLAQVNRWTDADNLYKGKKNTPKALTLFLNTCGMKRQRM